MKTNANQKERDVIIFGENHKPLQYLGGVEHFTDLTADKLKELVDKGYADPEERQNDGPETQEILEFLQDHPTFTAHGYAVSDKRDDYRVTLEGVASDVKPDEDDIQDFVNLFRSADEFTLFPFPYAWYD